MKIAIRAKDVPHNTTVYMSAYVNTRNPGEVVVEEEGLVKCTLYKELERVLMVGGREVAMDPGMVIVEPEGQKGLFIDGNRVVAIDDSAPLPLYLYHFYFDGLALGGQMIVIAGTEEEAQAIADRRGTPRGDRPRLEAGETIPFAGSGIVYWDNGDY